MCTVACQAVTVPYSSLYVASKDQDRDGHTGWNWYFGGTSGTKSVEIAVLAHVVYVYWSGYKIFDSLSITSCQKLLCRGLCG